jgi:hypothetical protein
MIKLLQKRGKFIAMGKINDFMKNESESRGLILRDSNFSQMKQPVKAFITFTTHEAALRCQKYLMKVDPVSYKKNKNLKEMILLGNKADIRAASEPSDVIWENLEVRLST